MFHQINICLGKTELSCPLVEVGWFWIAFLSANTVKRWWTIFLLHCMIAKELWETFFSLLRSSWVMHLCLQRSRIYFKVGALKPEGRIAKMKNYSEGNYFVCSLMCVERERRFYLGWSLTRVKDQRRVPQLSVFGVLHIGQMGSLLFWNL